LPPEWSVLLAVSFSFVSAQTDWLKSRRLHCTLKIPDTILFIHPI